MEGSLPASSFHPAAAATPSRYPSWVLLDRKAYFADLHNATTAEGKSSTGRIIKVTFYLADPPAVSHFCVHGPDVDPEHFAVEPRVLFSEKDLVLLCFAFTSGSRSSVQDCNLVEYFIYKAGRGNPSLKSIPATPPGTRNTLYVGVVPCDKDGEGQFFLADLAATATLGYYDISIFSSKTGKWLTRTLQLEASTTELRVEDMFIVPHKVITLGAGVVGWVDLWRGIIACNILEEDPFIFFIPLPKPEFNLLRDGDPKPVRDIACHNDVIKFVEMDHLYRREVVCISSHNKRFKMTKDLDSVDRMYDLDILLRPHEDFLEAPREQINYIPDGWKIRTCYRHTAWDHWRKGHIIHVDDILANNPNHSVLLPQSWDGCGKSPLRNLTTAHPTLSPNGDDLLYLMSYDQTTWMVGVDLEKKAVVTLEPYRERDGYFKPDFLPFAFSEFLNATSRSCAGEAAFEPNEAQNNHLLSGSSRYAECNAPGYLCSNSQSQPQLLSNQPQPWHLNLTSSVSVNSQLTNPVLNADDHGQLCLAKSVARHLIMELADSSLTPPTQIPLQEVQPCNEPANVTLTPLGKPAHPAVQAYRGSGSISTMPGMPAPLALQPDRWTSSVISPPQMPGLLVHINSILGSPKSLIRSTSM